MKSFHTSIAIAAPAEHIWQLLTNVSAWPTWNSTVDKVDGSAKLGGKVTVYAKASPGRAFPLKVTEFVPNQRMVWTGGMPLGLFTGTRTFLLVPQSDHRIRFEMREEFRGLMAPLITRSIPDLQPSFEEFAQCLRTAAERSK